MTSFLEHPVLRTLETYKHTCSSDYIMRTFHLYMNLCEVYRVDNVNIHLDENVNLIYLHTWNDSREDVAELSLPHEATNSSSSDAATISSSFTDEASKCPQPSCDPLRTGGTTDISSPRKDDYRSSRKDGTNDISSPNDNANNSSPTKDGTTGSSPSTNAVHRSNEQVFLCLNIREHLDDCLLSALHNTITQRHPQAKLCIVPSEHNILVGDYNVYDGIDDTPEFCNTSTAEDENTGTLQDESAEHAAQQNEPRPTIGVACYPAAYFEAGKSADN